ncbi:long-chain fatty acid--CoA ligase [Novosphingobium sp. EMRT-2]|nr:long-chain fatty acid--CoA ligase [Novosphingobium sp. EMRT-2]
MRGLMQNWPMTLDRILAHAASTSGSRRIAMQRPDGSITASDYASLQDEAKALSAALAAYGIGLGDRIGTLLWNDLPHMTVWYGAMGIGAVVHTLNPRFDAVRLAWLINHAGDRLLVVDAQFADTLRQVADRLPTVEHIVIASGKGAALPIGTIAVSSLEDFLGAGDPSAAVWGGFDEETAAGLCYTSGTTGDPKGVLYSHRSNFLHALCSNQPNGFAIAATDVVLPIVPMFHANAWGWTYIAPMAGAGLVLPGPRLDGASLQRLIVAEGVTFAAAVPTVWQDLLRHVRETGASLGRLARVLVGGAAVPSEMVRAFREDLGIEVMHGWGMTELSPLGAISSVMPDEAALTAQEVVSRKARQGRALFPVEARIVGADDKECPHDDATPGSLQVRGPAVVRRYYGAEEDAVDAEGWFDTGDIAVIDGHGFIKLVDRAKDVVKSGGEWISSVELENHAMGCPGVRRAAVIAIPDPRWGERPLLIAECDEGDGPSDESILAHLRPLVPKYWLPERIVFASVPLGATGKIDKLALRRLFAQPLQIEAVND